MTRSRPELIFLAGPEKDQRVALTADPAIVGRSESADVRVTERYVSREQIRFTLRPEGWIVENLSGRAMRINGKKYGRKKKIVLATGDLIGMGVSTEILFIAPGDDPEEALKQFRRSHVPPPQAKPPEAPAPPAEAPKPAKRPEVESLEEGEPKTAQIQVPADQRKRKLKKYGIMFGIYGLVMLVLIIWLSATQGGEEGGISGSLKVLTDEEIARALSDVLERPRNPSKATEKLREALYYHNIWNQGDLYRCVKRFKEYLAYAGRSSCQDATHEEKFKNAKRQLIKEVQDQYRVACVMEEANNWPDARAAFEKLLLMVPEENELQRDEVVYQSLIVNVRQHLANVNRRSQREEE